MRRWINCVKPSWPTWDSVMRITSAQSSACNAGRNRWTRPDSLQPGPAQLGCRRRRALGFKILENMEVGHNVMHGQYDWMNDPKLQSQSYEWDTVCDGDSWRKTHNYEHHTYTNILGKDRITAMPCCDCPMIPWKPRHLFQFANYAVLSLFFQWGVGLHELETEKLRWLSDTGKKPFLKRFARKATRQLAKDYVGIPCAGRPFRPSRCWQAMPWPTALNLWASTIIFCGHFTEDAQTFSEEECENESRGMWYYRQILGSSNFTGGRWLHIMSGHLSYQVEHHLFPDIPAHRYPEMSNRVQALCEKYNTLTTPVRLGNSI